jgi:hypothetical protein
MCGAVLRLVVACKNRELLDRIRPEIHPQRATWRTIYVIIDADPIQAGIVLARTAPGYGHLVTEAALCLAGLLRTSAGDPRLQSGQIRCGTTIER